MSRLTDEELDKLAAECADDGNGFTWAAGRGFAYSELRPLVTELRERRHADLTAQDLEALRWMRAQAQRADAGAPTVNTQRALAVLDKLLAREVEK